MDQQSLSQPKQGKAGRIVGAFFATAGFGLLTAVIGLIVASQFFDYVAPIDTARAFMLFGLLGMVATTLAIIATWSRRTRTFFAASLIFLWIGLGLYGLILAGGTVGAVIARASSTSETTATHDLNNTAVPATCSVSPIDQLRNSDEGIVPISTNEGSGTAFAIDDKGTLLTAYHVIEGARTVTANYADGRQSVRVLQTAPEYDLALLQLDSPTPEHFTLTDSYKVADQVYVYGYPGNTFTAGSPSVSDGIVSRVITNEDLRLNSRSIPRGLEVIQTDAAINPGNSGGPLINGCGVVGIVNSISDSSQLHGYVGVVSEQGIGYAISAKTAAERFNLTLKHSE